MYTHCDRKIEETQDLVRQAIQSFSAAIGDSDGFMEYRKDAQETLLSVFPLLLEARSKLEEVRPI